MNIYISYSASRSVEYCFWKDFFQTCGFWVKSEKITEQWKVNKTIVPQLVILDQKDEGRYEEPCDGIAYCVRSSYKRTKNRIDIVNAKWWKKFYQKIVQQLFVGNENLPSMLKMVSIFAGDYDESQREKTEEGLWSAVWLFNEMAQFAKNEKWDSEIIGKAGEALKNLKLEKKKNWHQQYMMIYCRYLQCGVTRSLISRIEQVESILKECEELASIGGWTPSLSLLAGKVSLLTSTENKNAVNYFNRVLKYEVRPEYLYDIGHIYEMAYGDMSQAWLYYFKAYKENPDYFRALYKLAINAEQEEDWMRAISAYSKIRKIIAQTKLEDSISIRELEYEYKACKKILQLSRRYINDDEFQNHIKNQIKALNKNVFDYFNFEKLIYTMFIKEHRVKKVEEIKAELQKKVSIDCCN